MTINKITAIIFLACLSLHCNGQSDSTAKKTTQYLGLQANQLLRQIFNFGGNSIPVNNPYLINYSIVNSASNSGVNAGLGYNIDQSKGGDPTNSRENKSNSLFFRVGYEKKLSFGKRWLMGLGADVLIENSKSETTSNTNLGGGKSEIKTTSKQSGFGLGPRCTLSYYITPRILVGTETTYYFKALKNNADVKSTTTNREVDPNTGALRDVTRTETTKTDDKFKNLNLNLPAVLWLILKF
jgi:hypothetical protein